MKPFYGLKVHLFFLGLYVIIIEVDQLFNLLLNICFSIFTPGYMLLPGT